MTKAALNADAVLAWIAENPNALRQASAQTAADVLNGPIVQAALDALTAAVAVSQDSAPRVVGQAAAPGAVGTAQSLQRVVDTITLGRIEIANRLAALTPADPEA